MSHQHAIEYEASVVGVSHTALSSQWLELNAQVTACVVIS